MLQQKMMLIYLGYIRKEFSWEMGGTSIDPAFRNKEVMVLLILHFWNGSKTFHFRLFCYDSRESLL